MRRFERIAALAAVAACIRIAPLLAQQPIGPERIVVPLTRPGAPASVEVSLMSGGISVEAYDGKEVIVEARTRGGRPTEPAERKGRRDAPPETSGMRRIPNDSAGLSVEEDGNRVEINAETWKQAIDIHLMVPATTSLQLGCINSGDIKVTGVEGEMELSNVNGGIEVRGAAAPVVASSVNGRLLVAFVRLEGTKPMAFNTLNGNVDLTLPATVKANVQLRSDNGEIFSDFEVALDREPARVEQERRDGKFRVVVEKGVRGTIGGGGREIRITTFNGDILLRRQK